MSHYESQNAYDDAILNNIDYTVFKDNMAKITRNYCPLNSYSSFGNCQTIDNDIALKLYNAGFNHFKLDGREYSDDIFSNEFDEHVIDFSRLINE